MAKLKSILRKSISAIIIGTYFLLVLKSCFVTVWVPSNRIETYAIYGSDGRFMKFILFPDNKALLLSGSVTDKSVEAVLAKVYGTVATHYWWRFWNVSEDGSPFGLRIFPSEVEPIIMKIKIIDRFIIGGETLSFGKTGSEYTDVLLFTSRAVRFDNMWLQKEETDEKFVSNIMGAFSDKQD